MYKELAYRENNGIVVTLWLHSDFNQLRVSVHDERTGDVFALDVDADNALDVFQHPFAYASRRGTQATRTAVMPHEEAYVGARKN
jgi:hypothetical protein